MEINKSNTKKEQNKFTTRRYSFIYNNLVHNSNDFIGLVAYSIYKQEKIQYIQNFEKEKNRTPNTEELFDFHKQAQCRIAQYEEIATSRVNKFYDKIYSKSATNLKHELYKEKGFGWVASITQSVI